MGIRNTEKEKQMKTYLLFVGLMVYTTWTWRFVIRFHKSDTYFDKEQKVIHNALMWLIPFLWIMIIKIIVKPRLRGEYAKPKNKDTFYESEMEEKLA